MKAKILKQLRNHSSSVSGQELCSTLGVSRTMVWKVINQLKETGYVIEAVSNKGYRLVSAPDLITAEEVESRLNTSFLGKEIKFYEEIDSTNTKAKYLAEEGAPHGTLVIAEQQNAGKGRRGKSWSSPKGSGIWMTLLLRPGFKPTHASMLTLVAAMAVSAGIEQTLGLKNSIKWPNDLVVNGKKICGILTEMSAELDYINHIVVGIGINANMEKFPTELSELATSLAIESGRKIVRAELISAVLSHFETYYETFLKTENLTNLIEEYNNKLINANKEVKIISSSSEYIGHAIGINELGELLVKDQSGTIKAISSGEVSVRGVYGYTP